MTAAVLAGRGALVTGGGRGIGAAVAQALCHAGARVVVASRTAGDLDHVAEALRATGGEAWGLECDVTDETGVARLAEAARGHVGAVDVLVNAAGDASSAPLARITLAEWNRLLAVNATAAFLVTRQLAPAMVERGWGRIVNLASIAGLEGAKYIAHYSASKHALVGFTRSLAIELDGTGITVNAVCPGYVDTAMTERTLENVQARTGMDRARALAAVLASAGQERLVRPDEVAAAVLELCLSGDNGRLVTLLARAGDGR